MSIDIYQQTLSLKRETSVFNSQFCFTVSDLLKLKQEKENFLHPKELAYFQGLAYERRQQSYLLGRFIAKNAITLYQPGAQPNEVVIENGVFDFPVVVYPGKTNIQVSYTHCQDHVAALAFSELQPMAIDIEKIDAERTHVMASQLIDQEKAFIQQIDSKDLLYTLLWTAKEALSKVLRTGLMTPFELFAIHKLTALNSYSWQLEFGNFGQYQALSYRLGHYMMTIVLPKKTRLTFNFDELLKWYQAHG